MGGVGCCWSVVAAAVLVLEEGCREPQLKRGHFSPVIALCGSSPRGSVTAAEARRCYDAPSQKSSAKMPNAADENLTYCPKTSGEKYKLITASLFFSFFLFFPCFQSRTLNSPFISPDGDVIYVILASVTSVIFPACTVSPRQRREQNDRGHLGDQMWSGK